MSVIVDWVLHLDTHLAALASAHGTLVYAALFGVIFIETGVVILPFLPGDSLLFVSGALAADGQLNAFLLFAAMAGAAISGDAVNFAIGAWLRGRVARNGHFPLIRQKHLEKTQAFFKRHGKKTIVLARFVPVVRTLAPFVAALGRMNFRTFLGCNVLGGALWVGLLLGAGYGLGKQPVVRDHLTAVILAIVALSVLPGLFEWFKERRKAGEGKPANG